MLGDAYFQLRAQIGTALFSLERLAAETGVPETTQAGLQAVQPRLRESFVFAALGPEGGGKSALLNTLFEREFCGPAEPAAAGRIAIFRHGAEADETSISPEVVEFRRPHIFLRDFTVIEAAGGATPEMLASLLLRADVIFYVVSATAAAPPEAWTVLSRLGRDLLKRLVFVVWQSDRVSVEEGAIAVKRLRQAMLKNLGQACPIFTGSTKDRADREKLERWIEGQVIFSEARCVRLREIGEVAREALREIVAKPRAERKAVQRGMEQLRRQREDLAELEEQSKRQVAGALWAMAQGFERLRIHGEELLRTYVGPFDLLWKRNVRAGDFAEEIEVQAQAALSVQWYEQLTDFEADLRQSAAEYAPADREKSGAAPPEAPAFSRASLEEELAAQEKPLDVAGVVAAAFGEAVRLLRLPLLAVLGVVAAALGTTIAGRPSHFLFALAGGAALFVVVLAVLLRCNFVAAFGRHFTENRAALLTALEPPLLAAASRFYAALAPALETEAERLAGERQQHEPLLARLRQIEETFARIEAALRAGVAGVEPG